MELGLPAGGGRGGACGGEKVLVGGDGGGRGGEEITKKGGGIAKPGTVSKGVLLSNQQVDVMLTDAPCLGTLIHPSACMHERYYSPSDACADAGCAPARAAGRTIGSRLLEGKLAVRYQVSISRNKNHLQLVTVVVSEVESGNPCRCLNFGCEDV